MPVTTRSRKGKKITPRKLVEEGKKAENTIITSPPTPSSSSSERSQTPIPTPTMSTKPPTSSSSTPPMFLQSPKFIGGGAFSGSPHFASPTYTKAQVGDFKFPLKREPSPQGPRFSGKPYSSHTARSGFKKEPETRPVSAAPIRNPSEFAAPHKGPLFPETSSGVASSSSSSSTPKSESRETTTPRNPSGLVPPNQGQALRDALEASRRSRKEQKREQEFADVMARLKEYERHNNIADPVFPPYKTDGEEALVAAVSDDPHSAPSGEEHGQWEGGNPEGLGGGPEVQKKEEPGEGGGQPPPPPNEEGEGGESERGPNGPGKEEEKEGDDEEVEEGQEGGGGGQEGGEQGGRAPPRAPAPVAAPALVGNPRAGERGYSSANPRIPGQFKPSETPMEDMQYQLVHGRPPPGPGHMEGQGDYIPPAYGAGSAFVEKAKESDSDRTDPITPATGSKQTPSTANSIIGADPIIASARKQRPEKVLGTAQERANMGKGAVSGYEFSGPYDFPSRPSGRPDTSLTAVGGWRSKTGEHSHSLWKSEYTEKGFPAKRDKYYRWSTKGGGGWKTLSSKDAMRTFTKMEARKQGGRWMSQPNPGERLTSMMAGTLKRKMTDINAGKAGNERMNKRKKGEDPANRFQVQM